MDIPKSHRFMAVYIYIYTYTHTYIYIDTLVLFWYIDCSNDQHGQAMSAASAQPGSLGPSVTVMVNCLIML